MRRCSLVFPMSGMRNLFLSCSPSPSSSVSEGTNASEIEMTEDASLSSIEASPSDTTGPPSSLTPPEDDIADRMTGPGLSPASNLAMLLGIAGLVISLYSSGP